MISIPFLLFGLALIFLIVSIVKSSFPYWPSILCVIIGLLVMVAGVR